MENPTINKPLHEFHLYCCLVLELDCLYNSTSFWLSLSACEITYYLSTLSKRVSPLITLSFNHPKPTKGPDALSLTLRILRLTCHVFFLPFSFSNVQTPLQIILEFDENTLFLDSWNIIRAPSLDPVSLPLNPYAYHHTYHNNPKCYGSCCTTFTGPS